MINVIHRRQYEKLSICLLCCPLWLLKPSWINMYNNGYFCVDQFVKASFPYFITLKLLFWVSFAGVCTVIVT